MVSVGTDRRRLNPFSIRSAFKRYAMNYLRARQRDVLIPSRSGLLSNFSGREAVSARNGVLIPSRSGLLSNARLAGLMLPGTACLNPFSIRSAFKLDSSGRESRSRNGLNPFSIRSAFKRKQQRSAQQAATVLIPSRSGLLSNRRMVQPR